MTDKIIPSRVQNIVGKRYGRWTVTAFSHTLNKSSYWECICDCGTTRTHQRSALVSNSTLSCGCLRGEQVSARNTTHGKHHSSEYNSWRAMKERCQNKNATKYPAYGGRGITVCERWQRFEGFFSDMGPKPTPFHSIERIDNNGNYEPNNCRWVTGDEQAINRRNNHRITIDGVTLTIAEFRRHFGISKSVYDGRIHLGWSIIDALKTPVNKR